MHLASSEILHAGTPPPKHRNCTSSLVSLVARLLWCALNDFHSVQRDDAHVVSLSVNASIQVVHHLINATIQPILHAAERVPELPDVLTEIRALAFGLLWLP